MSVRNGMRAQAAEANGAQPAAQGASHSAEETPSVCVPPTVDSLMDGCTEEGLSMFYAAQEHQAQIDAQAVQAWDILVH